MRIFLDDAACDEIQVGSVAEAVTAAAAVARRNGRSVVDVIVDGLRWDVGRLVSVEARAAGGACEVRLASVDPRDLVCEAFIDAANALGEIDQLQQTAAEWLQTGRTQPAMERLGRALELWGSVHEAVSMGAAMVGLDLASERSTIESLTGELKGLRDALERGDVGALADALLYDLPDVASQWRALLHSLRERVRTSAKGGRKA